MNAISEAHGRVLKIQSENNNQNMSQMQQTKSNHKNIIISKVQQISQETGVKIKNVESMRKSIWKKQVKKIGKKIEERKKQEMINKAKARTIVKDMWERKKYLQESDSDTVKDVNKVRLHMRQVNLQL